MKSLAYALTIFGALFLSAAATTASAATDNCACIVSNDLSGGVPPVAYQFRACYRNGRCEQWLSQPFTTGASHSIKVHCNPDPGFVRFELRFGLEVPRVVNLARTQAFHNIPSDVTPSCACVNQAQFHFVRDGNTIELKNGLPNIGLQACRMLKAS